MSKVQSVLLWLGTCFGGNSPRECLGPLLFLIYVNDMPLQVQNGPLLQFADDTCLICYGDDHTQIKDSSYMVLQTCILNHKIISIRIAFSNQESGSESRGQEEMCFMMTLPRLKLSMIIFVLH